MRFSLTAKRDPEAETERDFGIDADPTTPTRAVVELIAADLGADPASELCLSRGTDEQALTESQLDAPIGRGPLVQGARLTFSSPPSEARAAEGLVEVVTVRGPGVGEVRTLPVGRTALGVSAGGGIAAGLGVHAPLVVADIAFDGHVRLRLSPGVEPTRHLPVALESEPVTGEPMTWLPGEYLRIGETSLLLRPVAVSAGRLIRTPGAATLDFNRPPAVPQGPVTRKFRIPRPPERNRRMNMMLLYAIMPVVSGITMAVIFQRPYFLMFALLSPIMMLGNWLTQRRDGVKTHRQQLAAHRRELEAIDREVSDAVARETATRRSEAPSPSDLLQAVTHTTRKLWERRTTTPAFLRLRVGVGDLPSGIEISDEEEFEFRRTESRTLRSVPVTIGVREAGVVGVAVREQADLDATVDWLVGQIAALHLPANVSLYLLSAGGDQHRWDWARWLPHVDRGAATGAMTRIAIGADEAAPLVAELTMAMAERAAAASVGGSSRDLPSIVVVLDGARALRALPGVVPLLRDGPALGINLVCADASVQQLPEECVTVVSESPSGRLRVKEGATEPVEADADLVAPEWYDVVPRCLHALRDVSRSSEGAEIPAASRLLDLLGIEEPDSGDIAELWRSGGRTTRIPIGESFDGAFTVDLVRDGPHGLIAGTTGSGKSELLQTIVASAATANRPDEMTFVLVDYKGGAAFAACESLPHTVGFVTDLDAHLVERALTSLHAELTRREHLLGTVGAKDIEDYQRFGADRPVPTLARLVIVIDEFATLARELPEFISGLVNIAQRGRSLGVHLVLATQRPAGVVSTDIRANTNLRIALRVTDASESQDVIDVKSAVEISKSTPGRAFARLGQATILPFQTSRIGGRHPIAEANRPAAPPPEVRRLAPASFRRPAPTAAVAALDEAEATDLELLVSAITGAVEASGIVPPESPWLPPLADVIELDELGPAPEAEEGVTRPFAWGRVDRPRQQQQAPELFDLDTMSHLFLAGSPGSGRTQAIRTFVGAAARANSPSDLHVYGVDCGNGGLAVLGELPHCGGIAGASQVDQLSRILSRLADEVEHRSGVLSTANASSIAEQRASATFDQRLPHILFLLDRWESFQESLADLDGGRIGEGVTRLLREGPSVGVHVVATGDRSLLNSRNAQYARMRGALRFDDSSDYGYVGFRVKDIPADPVPGRMFWADRGVEEMQIAVLDRDLRGTAQAEAVRRIAHESRTRFPAPAHAVRRLRQLPKSIEFAEMMASPADVEHALFATVGVGGDDVRQLGADLADVNTFLVAGPRGSGRSTVLTSMTRSLLHRGAEVVLLAPKPSPLTELAGEPGVRALLTDLRVEGRELSDLIAPGEEPVVLVIDDAELFRDGTAADFLVHLVRAGKQSSRALLVAGESETIGSGLGRAWNLDVKRNRRGVLLSPANIYDAELIGTSIPRSRVSTRISLGTGILHAGGGEAQIVRTPGPR